MSNQNLATQTYVDLKVSGIIIPVIDLSPYATLSGSVFTGNISAPNLSGTNTGDQNLSFIEGDITNLQQDVLTLSGDIQDINQDIISLSAEVDTKVDILSGHSDYQTLSSATIQNKLSFTPIAGVTSVALGDLVYNADEHTLSFGVEDGSLEFGKEVVDCYTNLAGVTLVDGDVVSVCGASGNRQAVCLTNITNPTIANSCIGVVTRGNTPNNLVRVTKIGKVHGLNTDAYTEGTVLYVSSINPGKFTSVKPTAPNTYIVVGSVEVKHQNVGVISVDIRISPRLEDLSDVNGTALTTDGQIITWHPSLSAFDFDKNINNYAPLSAIPSITGLATETFVTSSVSSHNIDNTSHSDIRNLALSAWHNPAVASDFTWTSDGKEITITGYTGTNVNVIIPEMLDGLPVTSIAGSVFDSSNIQSIYGASIKTIGLACFSVCQSLETVNFPLVENIGASAFSSCVLLTSVTFAGNQIPTAGIQIYSNIPENQVINYVTNPTSTGWGTTFGGMPVVRSHVYASDITATGNISASNLEDYKTYSGFENRTDSTISINSSTGVFTLSGASFNVWSNGEGKHTLTGTHSVTVTADQNISYIYIDHAGVLSIMETPWSLTSGVNAPCAIVYKDSTNYALTDERHSYERNKAWHNWAHFNIGAMYRSGLTGTFGNATISVTQGIVSDEDIVFDTLTTKTSTSLFYRNGSTGMRMVRNSNSAKGLTTGNVLAYDNNSGTLQEITVNRYATNWVYATNDPLEPIYTVISQGNYSSTTNARNALAPTINLSTAEWKLIYRVIYQRTTGTPSGVFVEASDFRTVTTGTPTNAITTDHSSLINRDAANSHPATAISYGVTDVDTALTNISNSLSGYSTTTFTTSSVSSHNVDGSAHTDIRNLITPLQTVSKSFVITNPTAGTSYAIWRAPFALTITGIHGVQIGGTNIIGMLTECDADGLNPVKINSTDMTITTSSVSLTSFSNPSVDSGDYIGWSNTSISGAVNRVTISFEYVRS